MKQRLTFFLLFLLGIGWAVAQKKPLPPKPKLPVGRDSLDIFLKKGDCEKARKLSLSRLVKIPVAQTESRIEALATLTQALVVCKSWQEAYDSLRQAWSLTYGLLDKSLLPAPKTLVNLANLGIRMGKLGETEGHCREALNRVRKIETEPGLAEAALLSGLGNVCKHTNRFKEAGEVYQKALDIELRLRGEEFNETAELYNNLGIIHWRTDQLPAAEAFFQKSLAIRRRLLGEEHPDVSNNYNNLGLVYVYMGNLERAEEYFLKALDFILKQDGENSLRVATAYNNLGNLNKDLHRYARSADYAKKALDIRLRLLPPRHPDIGHSYNNLCGMHWQMGNYYLAEQYGNKAMAIFEADSNLNQLEMAGMYINYANVFGDQGLRDKASEVHEKCLRIRREEFGEGHPELAQPLHNEAINLRLKGDLGKAERYFLASNQIYLDQVRQFFPSLSDEQKETFFETIKGNIQEVQSFAVSRYASNPRIAGDLFNHQLATKALLLNSTAKWKQRIKTSGDKKLFLRFTEWEALQGKLAELYQDSDPEDKPLLDSLKNAAEKLEKELSFRSENFAQLTERKQYTWQEVQQTLKPREAAIEIIRTQAYGVQKTVTDTSHPARPRIEVQGLISIPVYVALILKANGKPPEMVVLPHGDSLEGAHFHYYQNCVKRFVEDNRSYTRFWKPIAARLKGIKTGYLSPDGVFLKLNLNTLKNPETGKFLLEELDLRLLTSCKDLTKIPASEPLNRLAYLVGFPSYYLDSVSAAKGKTRQRSMRGLDSELAPLPDTKIEVERVSQALKQAGFEVKTFLEESAGEEALKDFYKPRVLHIATHGYFVQEDLLGTNPLLRSGLMLAGAGTSLKYGKSEKTEDGILTAYEAMNLNLDNTDLVVLSACETGLGEIKNGEGVYGLQRAFKVAGARSLIMSLWKVDDEATQELMVSFYRHWLSQPDGSKRTAFLKAQKELKAKYPQPYFWGAFVLVGE